MKRFILFLFLISASATAAFAACPQAGQMRNNGGKLEYCNGTNWRLIGAPDRIADGDNCGANDQALIYTANHIEFCNHAARTKFVTTDGSITAAGCAIAGQHRYDTNLNIMQFCNGTRWVNMGSVASNPCCPDGFIPVPRDAESGTSTDFCVSKYHMKPVAAVTGVLENGIGKGNDDPNNYFAQSRAANTPWSNITFSKAMTKCSDLGADFHLITNPEWMTVAKSIELTTGNWAGGLVGSGHIPTGHSDGAPNAYLPANSNDNLGCDGTGNLNCLVDPNEFYQKRTFVLLTNAVIWDFAGNINSWVSPDLAGSALSYPKSPCAYIDNNCIQEIGDGYNMPAATGKFHDISPALYPKALPTNLDNWLAFYPFNLRFGAYGGKPLDQFGFGTISWNFGAGNSNNVALYRGGWFGETHAQHGPGDLTSPVRTFATDGTQDRRAGIYSAWLTNQQNDHDNSISFRCVYTPSY